MRWFRAKESRWIVALALIWVTVLLCDIFFAPRDHPSQSSSSYDNTPPYYVPPYFVRPGVFEHEERFPEVPRFRPLPEPVPEARFPWLELLEDIK
jgi:hypothetical protein